VVKWRGRRNVGLRVKFTQAHNRRVFAGHGPSMPIRTYVYVEEITLGRESCIFHVTIRAPGREGGGEGEDWLEVATQRVKERD
jgi:hypothetical protein